MRSYALNARFSLHGQRDGVPSEVLQIRRVADVVVAFVEQRRSTAVPGPSSSTPGERSRVDLQHLTVARDGQRDQDALQ